jgi:surface polysaccharide O-acyltransferase-like enzyme
MKNGNALKHIRGGIFSYLIVILWNVLMIYLWHATGKEAFLNQSSRLTPMNSPFILLASVELLIGFAKLKPHYNKKLNRLASATFGVYLIHDNGASRSYLWKVILKNPAMYGNSLMIVHAVISIAAVYLVCSSIDLIRQATVEKWFMNFVDKHLDRVEEKASAAVNRIVERGNL